MSLDRRLARFPRFAVTCPLENFLFGPDDNHPNRFKRARISPNLTPPTRRRPRQPVPDGLPFLYAEGTQENLGIVDPHRFANEVQIADHKLIDAQRPNRWNDQRRDEPLLNLAGARKWRTFSARTGWSGYAFSGVQGRAVARDSFLDGKTFTESRNVKRQPFVADVSSGLDLMSGRFQLPFTRVRRTPEFETQPSNASRFGSFSTTWTF